jgi:superfamily II DNA or RNA helicase
MQTDLTFITNENNQSLLERFKALIKDTRLFDVLVGYFFTSGFHSLYKSLEPTEKIRVLIGISTDRETVERIQKAKTVEQTELVFSHKEAKEKFGNSIAEEMENSEDHPDIEEGVFKFIEWLKNGKLEIRAYPTTNIHAKLYIMTFAESDRDKGRVITGSSNFTEAGLRENLEFNVELKNANDYDFALTKFNELWREAVDVGDRYIESIQTRTWLNDTITPHELYLKFLYEYFKDQLSRPEDLSFAFTPVEVKKLAYQEQAVLNAQQILESYGGVFISDVVGLGKTYVAAMLAQQFPKKELTLVIAPPVLLNRDNPGSWPCVFQDFRVLAEYDSLGQLDRIIRRGTDKYTNIIIDEAHRFRTEGNVSYEKLAQICRGKRVILVTATPYNNSPSDILSQVKLFQNGKKSTIPGLPNLERFFGSLQKRLKELDRQKDHAEFVRITKENAKEIREKVLKHLMVRRTRSEIAHYFGEDLKAQNLKFPEVDDPVSIFYQLNEEEDRIFSRTAELVISHFRYARYRPSGYLKKTASQAERLAQDNMGKFMKILLIKRLESSFFAFRNTIGRFITSYKRYLDELKHGFVYVSKDYTSKIYELLENDDEASVLRLIDEGKAERHTADEFDEDFQKDLEHDYALLLEIAELWKKIDRDPKLLAFKERLKSEKILQEQKLIIFTESKETAEYLCGKLQKEYPHSVLCYTGGSGAAVREKVIENFDARARIPKDDYRILISTEVLSEGVNLHRSNVVINYDIPWNPTRMMQRVGRINRVDTKFDRIYTFNFFPTKQSNDLIKLEEAAKAKIHAFISLLGADARLLTDGEVIETHELFDRLLSKKTLTGEDDGDDSELKYLQVIKDLRDKNLDLFERVKRLPKKARIARAHPEAADFLITYFRKGKLQKFFQASTDGGATELDFITAAKLLEANPDETRATIPKDYYQLLDRNKQAFVDSTTEEILEPTARGGRDTTANVLHILKAKEIRKYQGYTDEEEDYINRVIMRLEEGGIPKQTTKTLITALREELKTGTHPRRILALLKKYIAEEFLVEHRAQSAAQISGPREVILSEYYVSK